jgi:thioredoxin family protein
MLMNQTDFLKTKFHQGLSYADFVALGDAEGHRMPWDQRYSQLALNDEQATLVGGFTRKVHVLCLTGTWCGDCALQGSAMQRIAEANPDAIDLRFLLRSDEHADLVVKSQINAGFRVPVTWFLAEDFEPVSWFGDRTLSRYRAMARNAIGPEVTATLPPPSADPVREVLQEVLDEFERVHLLLRLSGRLREKHGD